MNYLRAILGLLFFCVVAWTLSSHKKRVRLGVVVAGLVLQVVLAFVIIETDAGRTVLGHVSDKVAKVLSFGNKGTDMVFGTLGGFYTDPTPPEGPPAAVTLYPDFPYHLSPDEQSTVKIALGLRALPTIIYFSAVMAILYHLGIMQRLIYLMARFMSWAMGVSGAESLAMAANVFVGQTEAPLVVKPYVKKMTLSELNALMTGGFATIAGSVLAAYIGILGSDYAGHLLAASFMSAPAAFVMAKIMLPETEEASTAGNVELVIEKEHANVLDAAAGGTSDGLKLYLNVLAMLIAFVAMMALVDYGLSVFTVGGEDLSLQRLFGWVFAPVAWMMGVAWADCQAFGAILGTKIGVNEFVAFGNLGALAESKGMSDRSLKMGAYALCGFANFASIGIQIGGIAPLAPERRADLSRLALRAMLGGAFASWMTATVAGMFLD